MTTKLNLTIDENTAKKIKVYAAKKKTSVSKLTEEHFQRLLQMDKKQKGFKSFVEKYAGILTGSEPIDIKKERDAYLKEKYGV